VHLLIQSGVRTSRLDSENGMLEWLLGKDTCKTNVSDIQTWSMNWRIRGTNVLIRVKVMFISCVYRKEGICSRNFLSCLTAKIVPRF
jgi:hypothetical protein